MPLAVRAIGSSRRPTWIGWPARVSGWKMPTRVVPFTVHPAGHRAFFHRQEFLALERTEHRADRSYARWYGIPLNNLASVFDGQFCIVYVHVCSNIVCCRGVSFRLQLALPTAFYSKDAWFWALS